MKKILMLLAIVAIFAACQKDETEELTLKGATMTTGTELVGQHFNLNIIGVKDKESMPDIAAGHVIFVDLYGESEINLTQSPDDFTFAVLDKNGTDEDGALFQLPEPGFEPYVTEFPYGFDTETDYSVVVRPLGKPGMEAEITTMAELSEYAYSVTKEEARLWKNVLAEIPNIIGIEWGLFCPSPVNVVRPKGKSLWTNVTAELLSVVYEIVVTIDTDPDPEVVVEEEIILHVRIPIFNELLEGEYWKYTNDGLKLLQVRFYPFSTDVTYDDIENGWDELP